MSFDWVSVGCGVCFMLLIPPFFCRVGDGKASMPTRGTQAVDLMGLGAEPRISPSGVLMHSSVEDASLSLLNLVGFGEGDQPSIS